MEIQTLEISLNHTIVVRVCDAQQRRPADEKYDITLCHKFGIFLANYGGYIYNNNLRLGAWCTVFSICFRCLLSFSLAAVATIARLTKYIHRQCVRVIHGLRALCCIAISHLPDCRLTRQLASARVCVWYWGCELRKSHSDYRFVQCLALDVYEPFTSMRCNKFSHTVCRVCVLLNRTVSLFHQQTHAHTRTHFMYIQYVNASPYMHFRKTCKLDINFPMPFILSHVQCFDCTHAHRLHNLMAVAVVGFFYSGFHGVNGSIWGCGGDIEIG